MSGAAARGSQGAPGAPEVVVCGEAMVLMLAEPGVPLERATAFRRSVAGAESNVATGLARLGHSVRWLGRVGAGPMGRAVLTQLRAEGIDLSYAVTDPAAPTGLLIRDSHPARAIDVEYHRAGSAAAHLTPGEITAPMVAGARLLHLTGITPMLSASAHRATLRLIELASGAGVLVSFDPNVRLKLGSAERWREVTGPLLDQADVVLAGADELALLGRTPESAAPSAAALVVKHRDKSATCRTPEGSWHRPAFTVPVTDPVGAGDAFAAGFLSGWLRGAPPGECLTEGAAIASLVVRSATDTDGLPDRTGLERVLAAGEDVHR